MAYDDSRTVDSASHYINTLVFTVVAGIVSMLLLLLVLRASEAVRKFSVFIITIEVGLVLIMAVAIYRIIVQERRAYKHSVNGLNNLLQVVACPDYWTRRGDTCYNTMISPANESVMFRMPSPGSGAADSSYSINLKDYTGRPIAEVCEKASKTVGSPWTAVTAVCDSFRIRT